VSKGVISKGVVSKGVVSKGVVSKGVINKGVVSKGVVSKGVISKGVVSKGVVSKGVISKGVVSNLSMRRTGFRDLAAWRDFLVAFRQKHSTCHLQDTCLGESTLIWQWVGCEVEAFIRRKHSPL
jgi:hypothetical protein